MPTTPGNIIRLTATPEGADKLASVLTRALEHAREETGTTTWFAARSESDPTSFFLVDLFTDEDSRNAHFAGAAAALILGEGGPLFAGPPEISAIELLAGKNV